MYKRVQEKPITELRVAGICQREHSFYVDTVSDFKQRRIQYKTLKKVNIAHIHLHSCCKTPTWVNDNMVVKLKQSGMVDPSLPVNVTLTLICWCFLHLLAFTTFSEWLLLQVWTGRFEEARASGNPVKIQEAADMCVLYESLQLAHKCILNSFYGYVMRKGARWYSMEMAGVVTYTGAQIIQRANKIVGQVGRPDECDNCMCNLL